MHFSQSGALHLGQAKLFNKNEILGHVTDQN